MGDNGCICRRLTIVFTDKGMTRLNIIIDVSAKYSDKEAELMAESQLKLCGYMRISTLRIPSRFVRFIRVHSIEEVDKEGIVG